jgi:UDP-N-acetylmuramoyl-L-alanyl-D-glutamate--2,6-diaminopimelate ligase
VEIRVGEERVRSTGTTPEAPDLHALLAVMLEHGADACAMEISSHALVQHRVDGLVLDVAGFTNLSRDHLDYHHSMEEYFAAKAQLFTPRRSRQAVICVDDGWGRQLARRATVPVRTVSARARPAGPEPAADWQVTQHVVVDGHPQAEVSGPGGIRVGLRSPLPGDFNLANSLVALAMLVAAGTPAAAAAVAIGAGPAAPGRMERIAGRGVEGEPLVVVDYAHSPDAVRGALDALQGSGTPVVVVLGAGGDRDRDKRSLMGAAAASTADVVIITDDNPRSEDPAAIRAALLDGARSGSGRWRAEGAEGAEGTVLEVADRRAAVAEGVRRAWGGGVLLIAGKGHELGQEISGQVLPFDDREVARQALQATAGLVGVPVGTGTDVEGTNS